MVVSRGPIRSSDRISLAAWSSRCGLGHAINRAAGLVLGNGMVAVTAQAAQSLGAVTAHARQQHGDHVCPAKTGPRSGRKHQWTAGRRSRPACAYKPAGWGWQKRDGFPGRPTKPLPGSGRSPSCASRTWSGVWLPSQFASPWANCASTCCTMTTGAGKSAGRRASTFASAAGPPADAPMATK